MGFGRNNTCPWQHDIYIFGRALEKGSLKKKPEIGMWPNRFLATFGILGTESVRKGDMLFDSWLKDCSKIGHQNGGVNPNFMFFYYVPKFKMRQTADEHW